MQRNNGSNEWVAGENLFAMPLVGAHVGRVDTSIGRQLGA